MVAPVLAELALVATVLDALDDGEKDLTFALIQDHCAREIRRSTREPDRRGPARGDDRSFVRPQTGTPSRRAAVQRRQDFSSDRPGDISAFLCNILEANNVQPKQVLRASNLPTHDLQDGHALDALFYLVPRSQPPERRPAALAARPRGPGG